ncbi:DNA glycosylase [Hysterangium stoloniferum]|nr:DNA glycosylase [Hysterangium stoloniferum]
MTLHIPAGFRALPLPIAQLSLAAVLKCGQSFRWTTIAIPSSTATTSTPASESDGDVEYRFVLKDRVICLRQSPEILFYRSLFPNRHEVNQLKETETLVWLRDYFQLDVDLVKLYDNWSEIDPVFSRLRDRFVGIRMLRQDPWENLVSFICSQNNHISRITSMVQNLCTHFSPALMLDLPSPSIPTYHPFPSPSILAAPGTSATLRSLGFGYRAEYIQRTAQMLVDAHGADGAEAFLDGLRQRSTTDARQELLRLMGVGRKVADCVLLMSLDKHEVVPVDTHVHKIAVKHYGLRGAGDKMNAKLYDDVQVKLTGVWGGHAGWAHSVLFTADLKSFSSYGLPTPSPSVSPEKLKTKKMRSILPKSPSSSPTKRKRTSTTEIKVETAVVTSEENSLADRVKRRRTRSVAISYVEPVVA